MVREKNHKSDFEKTKGDTEKTAQTTGLTHHGLTIQL